MITGMQLSLQHATNWLPILLWVIISGFNFMGINTYESRHIETHHRNEMSDYYDACNTNRKFKYDVNELNLPHKIILLI